jgi:hypothetical protein
MDTSEEPADTLSEQPFPPTSFASRDGRYIDWVAKMANDPDSLWPFVLQLLAQMGPLMRSMDDTFTTQVAAMCVKLSRRQGTGLLAMCAFGQLMIAYEGVANFVLDTLPPYRWPPEQAKEAVARLCYFSEVLLRRPFLAGNIIQLLTEFHEVVVLDIDTQQFQIKMTAIDGANADKRRAQTEQLDQQRLHADLATFSMEAANRHVEPEVAPNDDPTAPLVAPDSQPSESVSSMAAIYRGCTISNIQERAEQKIRQMQAARSKK